GEHAGEHQVRALRSAVEHRRLPGHGGAGRRPPRRAAERRATGRPARQRAGPAGARRPVRAGRAVAAARARLAPGRRRERGGLNAVPGRPLTRWANAAMLAVAVAALGVLVAAFLPLVKVWAVHEWARTGSGGAYRLGLWGQAATAGGIGPA